MFSGAQRGRAAIALRPYCFLLPAHPLLITVRTRCDYTVKHLAQPLAHSEHPGNASFPYNSGRMAMTYKPSFRQCQSHNADRQARYILKGLHRNNASVLRSCSSTYNRSCELLPSYFRALNKGIKQLLEGEILISRAAQPAELCIHVFTHLPFKWPCPWVPISQPPSLLQQLWVSGEGKEEKTAHLPTLGGFANPWQEPFYFISFRGLLPPGFAAEQR